MISIDELKSKLPQDALKLIESTFDPALYNNILLSFREERCTTFRVNLLKADKYEVMEELRKQRFKFSNVDFIPNAFKLQDQENNRLLKSNLVADGKIYLQSISSLLPPIILDPKEGDLILDMAASPGSKTTQIAALTMNKSTIDAIEPDFIRMERLKHNTELLGANNINFFQTEGQVFCREKANYYDKILVDAPCSGEGRFSINDKNSYNKWKINNVEKLSNLQKKLLKAAIIAAKPDGVIVYSTCTLNVYENEAVIDTILNDKDINVKILKIDDKLKNLKESVMPLLKYKDLNFNKTINDALRIVPSKNTEGFFICKLKKC